MQTAKTIAAQEKQRKHEGILESYAEFWRICFSDFNEYILHIDDEAVPCQRIEIDISDEQYEQEKIACSRVTWESALDQFKEIYKSVQLERLIGSNSKKECDTLFWELVKKSRLQK